MKPARTVVKCDKSDPAEDFGKCGGEGFANFLPCESPAFLCVSKNVNYASCRRNGEPGGKDWDGIVYECM